MKTPLNRNVILHCLNLDTVGGVEQLFFHFIRYLSPEEARCHHLLITGNPLHERFQEIVPCLGSVTEVKRWHGLKLPGRPRLLRNRNRLAQISSLAPSVAVIWNRFDLPLLHALKQCGTRVVYYEHGAAWLAPDNGESAEFARGSDEIITASRAALRVLELRWDVRQTRSVVLNPLRPGMSSWDVIARPAPRTVLRLGVVARLIPLKGIGVLLYALKKLLEDGLRAELDIAGDGPLRIFLERKAEALGIKASVRFRGVVREMESYYPSIDFLLLPSIREPFGLVAVEAAAHGCPVIAAKVDGIPEAVPENESGLLIEPTLALEEYERFGGEPGDFPRFIYNPGKDALESPRFLDPAAVAEGVMTLLDSQRYQFMSARGIEVASQKFKFSDYAKKLSEVLKG
ncbi:MAG: glycosyltransferase family 4 protein [Verrucomicrobiota bacterium]|nr:glycosyltransferase family 4 protein [Verrucomicrobiota bacterium]